MNLENKLLNDRDIWRNRKRTRKWFLSGHFRAAEGHQCLCRAAGKLTKFRIKLLAGDKVLVEISPYYLTRGSITYRERNAGGARPTTNKNNPKRNNK